ncbi:MAG: hypothetical protein JWQ54_779 [Mucilaginibacter sp.]|nr:hypothetical protein [Mucilaginibacter sp.]
MPVTALKQTLAILNDHLINRKALPNEWKCSHCRKLHTTDLLSKVRAVRVVPGKDRLIQFLGVNDVLLSVCAFPKTKN